MAPAARLVACFSAAATAAVNVRRDKVDVPHLTAHSASHALALYGTMSDEGDRCSSLFILINNIFNPSSEVVIHRKRFSYSIRSIYYSTMIYIFYSGLAPFYFKDIKLAKVISSNSPQFQSFRAEATRCSPALTKFSTK